MKSVPAALILAMVLPIAGFASAATTAETKLHIEGMTCGGCAAAVKLVLKKTVGVVDATVSYEEKLATVTYDPGKTTPEKIAAAIAEKLGYEVTVIRDRGKSGRASDRSSTRPVAKGGKGRA